MVPGIEVTIGEVKYTLPPINVAMRREHKDFLARAGRFAEGSETPTNDDVLEMAKVVERALKRNYPEIDYAALEQALDDDKLLECFMAVMKAGRAGPPAGERTPGSR